MRLPNGDQAVVPQRKIVEYLLSSTGDSVSNQRTSTMIEEHESVVLQADVPEHGLRTGDLGTVVMVHQDGAGYTVEFMTLTGQTIAVVTLPGEQVRRVQPDEIAHVRHMVGVS